MSATPRNARAIAALAAGDPFVVSYVGATPLDLPHVYVDSGRSYDWSFAAGLHAVIVVRPGVAALHTFEDLFAVTELYPTLVDYERKFAAALVDDVRFGGLKPWPLRVGCPAWCELFGEAPPP